MHRLIYASRFTSRFPLERREQDYAINAIIRASTRHNRAAGVTSLLMTHRRMALQVLEGPRDAVTGAFERIAQDPRHDAVRLIASGEAAQREFGDWGLLTLRMDAGDSAILDRLDAEGRTVVDLSAEDALALLADARDVQARTLLAAWA